VICSDVTGDVDLTSGGRRLAVSGFPHVVFGLGWFYKGGLQSRWEIDAWRGYGSNTANPPDINLRQIRGSDIATSCWIKGIGSDGRREPMGSKQLWMRDLPNILLFINMAGGLNFRKIGFVCFVGVGIV